MQVGSMTGRVSLVSNMRRLIKWIPKRRVANLVRLRLIDLGVSAGTAGGEDPIENFDKVFLTNTVCNHKIDLLFNLPVEAILTCPKALNFQ